MNSIGNDVVWLPAAERKRCCQPRYYQKILSNSELLLFAHAPYGFPEFLWLIWSIKESVYKCGRTVLQASTFSPTAITVNQISFPSLSACKGISFHQGTWEGRPQEEWSSGEASLNGVAYTFRSWVTGLFIYTVAAAEHGLSDVHTGIQFIPDFRLADQSAEVRRFVLSRLSKEWPSREASTIVKAPAGYPCLQPAAGIPDIMLSFSHHGPLVSYAFVVSPAINNHLSYPASSGYP